MSIGSKIEKFILSANQVVFVRGQGRLLYNLISELLWVEQEMVGFVISVTLLYVWVRARRGFF